MDDMDNRGNNDTKEKDNIIRRHRYYTKIMNRLEKLVYSLDKEKDKQNTITKITMLKNEIKDIEEKYIEYFI
jgi:uncharacterized membrane protein YgaE (UPF0421/DUF939 family)